MNNQLVCLLLAAGKGRRFGGDKGLAQLPDGTPMALRSALNLRHAGQQALCVLRPGDDALHELLLAHEFAVVTAQDAELGMSVSLQAGINASPDAAGWMVALADMPLIKAQTYRQLAAVFVAEPGIVVPCFRSEIHPGPAFAEPLSGHPVIFPAHHKQALLNLRGDKGAKPILQQHADDIKYVSVDDPGILQDFDTRQALKRLFI